MAQERVSKNVKNGSPTSKDAVLGFGFRPDRNASYHFVVTIPRADDAMVSVSEHFVYDEDLDELRQKIRTGEVDPLPYPVRDPLLKVEISRYKWGRVAEDVKSEFNRRLRAHDLRANSWKTGENHVAAFLGKELVLLLWAIEEADPTLIPNAVANWQGLAPEERWWLYTTINAASGHAVEGRKRGWREAIRIAFTENPVTDRPYMSQSSVPIARKPRKSADGDEAQQSLLSFDDTETL